jgi:undecaprenyl-diphosphatase
MDFLFAAILGVVEGLTEFLPISSTGHLLIASALLHFPADRAFRETFDIFIQLGAIIAVVIYFAKDLIGQAQKIPSDKATQRFWLNVIIASIPAGMVGFFFRNIISGSLRTPLIIGVALVIGGVIFLLVEARSLSAKTHELHEISPLQALWVGIAQIIALIPGVSRSGATIIGGLFVGLDRRVATAFSFYLAIPILGSATVYELFSAIKDGHVTGASLPYLLIGTVVAFVFAYASIAWLLRYVATHNFRAFGIYRIIVGAIIIVLALFTSVLAG